MADIDALLEERLGHLIRFAARGFTRSLQRHLAGLDMTFGQWIFLRVLWAEDGLTQRALSVRAQLTEPTTHTALVKLEKLGYVKRKNLDGNNRRQHVFLTARGHDAKDILEPLAIDVNEVATKGLSDKEIGALRKILLTVIQNLAEDEARALSEGHVVPPTRGG
ncbi:MAG: winged helix-turn-helix transcriptional regulator [Rhizobiales bacterium]|nr:winged helix-turn-helix transcriptional regulator [Hyphomicrobiales bacterium]